MAAATQSSVWERMTPMAKRRRRVVFSGPWPVRMRRRSSSKALSRMLWTDATFQWPRLSWSRRRASAVSGPWLVMPRAYSTECLRDFLTMAVRSTRKACPTWGKVRWPLRRAVVRMARLSRRPCSREKGSRKSGSPRRAKNSRRSSSRVGWLPLAVNTKWAPRSWRKSASLRWVSRAAARERTPADRLPLQQPGRAAQSSETNNRRNAASASLKPVSVSITDLALVAGSEIRP